MIGEGLLTGIWMIQRADELYNCIPESLLCDTIPGECEKVYSSQVESW